MNEIQCTKTHRNHVVLLYIYLECQKIIGYKDSREDNLRFLPNYFHVICVTVIGFYTKKSASTVFIASGS